MKITVSKLDGYALVTFFRDGAAVHAESFKGKVGAPYARTIEFDGEYDSHSATAVFGVIDFIYEVSP